ncbi:7759_t:CDS:10 [Ambispora gerdemannii]|uniref:7759_t:CDS:1 n=1 Tax=Ambispora gerdemannii TaxID=144530 RepID=A0A9N8WF23_9GLOM|nr:7759_t:CDS:10 [Ambispora gerdemannii]
MKLQRNSRNQLFYFTPAFILLLFIIFCLTPRTLTLSSPSQLATTHQGSGEEEPEANNVSEDPNYCAVRFRRSHYLYKAFPSGLISDACCDYETVDRINADIYPKLHELIKTDFFKYYKLNLFKECPFWIENGQCMNRACSVETMDKTDIPDIYKSDVLGALKTSPAGPLFQPFEKCEFTDRDFCVVEDENDGVFVNLQDNPERFTGYAGPSAGRVWKSIYEENCFNIVHQLDPSRKNKISHTSSISKNQLSNIMSSIDQNDDENDSDDVCFEKRVYYRLISGLHSSISIHICDEYLNQTTGEWRPNLDCFISRIGSHPERIQNVYFNYVVLLRAISKLSPYLRGYEFCAGGGRDEDTKVKNMVTELTNAAVSCHGTFDEKLMFASDESRLLKEEFKNHFRNVSRIMDCVGCDKCRLWGKLQISGVGTALKVLFSYDDQYLNPSSNPNLLTRTEIVALFNTFNRFSESIIAIKRFRKLYHERVKAQTKDHTDDITTTATTTSASTKTNNTSQQPTQLTAHHHIIEFVSSLKDIIIPYAKSLSTFIIRQLEHWHIPMPSGISVID